MKSLAGALLLLVTFVSVSWADDYVRGYYRRDGSYIQPHYRSSPNSTPTDNYGFRGNMNPYTGERGTDSYRHSPRSPYYDGDSAYSHSIR